VFVLDRYEGLEARLLQDFTAAERERYVEANASALRDLFPADLVFANHVLLGGPVAAASGARYAVKAHGSELEYSMRGRPELQEWARASLEQAAAVFVGSAHIRSVLEEVVGHVERVFEVPPGVDVDEFVPEDRLRAFAGLLAESEQDPQDGDERHPDPGNAERFERAFSRDEPTVVYVGKLIENKGVQVLFDAVRDLEVRSVIVGFGDYRRELEAMAPPRTLFTGALEHRHLVHLLPLCDVSVVPSVFPEAFGMVAAEAASAGLPPVVADHSGLAEIAAGVAAEYPADRRVLTSFPTGDSAMLRSRLELLFALPTPELRSLGLAARDAVVKNWSWSHVAERLLQPFRH
jgi:glycosyltransferase involved in cell wall biosynthesis